MRKVLFLLTILLLILYFNCMKKIYSPSNNELTIKLLDDSIHIPQSNREFCIDTLCFDVSNYSKNNYVFYFEDSSFFFNNNLDERKYELFDTFISSYDGINLRFFDGDNNSIKTSIISYYIHEAGEGGEIDPEKNLVYLKAESQIELKAVLKFPNYKDFGEIQQKIENIGKARYVKIVYEPVPYLAKAFLEDSNVKMNGKFKYLKKRFTFLRPVSFNCEK